MLDEDEDHGVSFPLDGAADDDKTNTSIQTRRRRRGKMMYAEPVVLATIMSRMIFDIVATNVIEVQYCKSVLKVYEVGSCLNLTAPHFSSMQKYASNFLMIQMLLFSVCSVLALIFLGSWSDTFGRRPLILSGTIGTTSTLSMWFLATYSEIHPNYFLLLDLPLVLCGGTKIIMMGVKCYVCDTTTTDTRIFRMGVLAGLDFVGALVASLLCPYFQNIGYSFPLIASTVMVAAALLYTFIFLEESVYIPKDQRKLVSRNPFQWSNVKSIYITCFTKQPRIVAQILIFTTLLNAFSAMQLMGEYSVFYLFLQKALGWKVDDYSHLWVLIKIVQAFAAFTSTSKLLNLTEWTIISVLIGINFSSEVVFYLGAQSWLVYVTAPLGLTLFVNVNIIRSFLSKIVRADDIGKVFALCGIAETICPFLGLPIYTTVYKETMDTHPKAIFLVSAAIAFISAILCAKIYFLYRKYLSSPRLDDHQTPSAHFHEVLPRRE